LFSVSSDGNHACFVFVLICHCFKSWRTHPKFEIRSKFQPHWTQNPRTKFVYCVVENKQLWSRRKYPRSKLHIWLWWWCTV